MGRLRSVLPIALAVGAASLVGAGCSATPLRLKVKDRSGIEGIWSPNLTVVGDKKKGLVVYNPEATMREFGPLSNIYGSEEWSKYPLADWEPVSVTKRIESEGFQECGTSVKLRFLTDRRSNYLYVELTNLARKGIEIDVRKARFIFGDPKSDGSQEGGPVAKAPALGAPLEEGIPLSPDWTLITALPFPDKADFKGRNRIDFILPIQDLGADEICRLRFRLERKSAQPLHVRTFEQWTGFEAAFGGGTTLLHAGDRAANAGHSGAWNLSLSFFPFESPRHGVTLGALGHFLGRASVPGGTLSGETFFGAGYTYRAYLKYNRFYLGYDLIPSLALLALDNSATARKQTVPGVALWHQLNFNWEFAEKITGMFDGDFSLGVSVFHGYVPRLEAGGASLGGHSVGMLFRLVLGT